MRWVVTKLIKNNLFAHVVWPQVSKIWSHLPGPRRLACENPGFGHVWSPLEGNDEPREKSENAVIVLKFKGCHLKHNKI